MNPGHNPPASADHPRGQAGELLIETLVTITLSAVLVLGLIAFAFTMVMASATHRATVASTNEATKVAEAIDQMPYKLCGNAANPVDYSAALSQAASGYTATIQSLEFLQSSATRTSTWASGCPSGGDQGVQRITVRVANGSGSATVQLAKRNDACPGGLGTQVLVNQPC